MIPVFGYMARVLIDLGATHLFISPSFLPYANVRPTPIVGSFSIFLPTRNVIFEYMVFKDGNIQVGDTVFEVDLIPLNIVDLDVIG